MIFNGICPRCKKQALAERRVRHAAPTAPVDPDGPLVKTKCLECGCWVGYRPFEGNGSAGLLETQRVSNR